MNQPSELLERALGTSTAATCEAMSEMIRAEQFLLSEVHLADLENRNDENVSSWCFFYRVAQLDGQEQVLLLRRGLQSSSPRIREHACDIVGEAQVHELRGELSTLLDDIDPQVAEAARESFSALAEER